MVFSVLAARELEREPKSERRGRGRGTKETLANKPPPRSFTRTIVQAVFDSRSLLRNRMKTLAWQAIFSAMFNLQF